MTLFNVVLMKKSSILYNRYAIMYSDIPLFRKGRMKTMKTTVIACHL